MAFEQGKPAHEMVDGECVHCRVREAQLHKVPICVHNSAEGHCWWTADEIICCRDCGMPFGIPSEPCPGYLTPRLSVDFVDRQTRAAIANEANAETGRVERIRDAMRDFSERRKR